MMSSWPAHCLLPLLCLSQFVVADEPAVPAFDRARWQAEVTAATQALSVEGDRVPHYSRRGDAHFFLGHFAEAVKDYDRMVTLDASLDTSHWRRGIALFYAAESAAAAAQFERYHAFDNVDRENGIWRYLCQAKSRGLDAAQAGLLKYEKDDREPFGDVYRLFAGTMLPQDIVQRIETAQVSNTEREKRRFYAHLYLGLWHAVHDRPEAARPHLRLAVANSWGPTAGYGPQYMWHVGRLHYDLLGPE